MTFKVYRKDASSISPTRVRGAKVCECLFIEIPTAGEAVFMIVPSQREDRRTGYWLELAFKDGDFTGGSAYMVRNFLPVGVYPIMVYGSDVYERVETAWFDFKEVSQPSRVLDFTDCRERELEKRGQDEYCAFVRRENAAKHALELLNTLMADCRDVYLSMDAVIADVDNICGKYEKRRFGKIMFEDPCPVGEHRRVF